MPRCLALLARYLRFGPEPVQLQLTFVCSGSGPTPIDLSKATKLRDAVFWPVSPTVAWIITTLETITPKHQDLRQISIQIPFNFFFINADAAANVRRIIGETNYKEWLDLDRLVRFWESRLVHLRVTLDTSTGEIKQNIKCYVGCLLPEAMERGILI